MTGSDRVCARRPVGKLLHSIRESDAAPKASHTAVIAKPTVGRVQPARCESSEAVRSPHVTIAAKLLLDRP